MTMTRLILPFAALILFANCSTDKQPKPIKAPAESAKAPAQQPAEARAPEQAASLGSKVLETMNAGGYTYVHLETGGKQDWYAVPECAVEVGERVVVGSESMAMPNFESKTLGRTFDVIYFAQALQKVGAASGVADAGAAAALVQKAHADTPAAKVEVQGIEKADGGMTVAEIWEQGAAGAGKEVALRGKVVKYNGGILGRNWLHVRDGSGSEGSNDITVTTAAQARVGDTVLVTGKLATDRDFGAGYIYPLLIEDAKIVIE